MMLKYYFFGEGNLKLRREETFAKTPEWREFINIIVPENGFKLSGIEDITHEDRIFIFDEWPFHQGNINKLIDSCIKKYKLTPITVFMLDDGRKVGYTDIDTKEQDIENAKKHYAQKVGNENVFLFDEKSGAELFILKYTPLDEQLISLYENQLKERYDYINENFEYEYEDDLDLLYIDEKPDSRKRMSTYVDKYSASNYNYKNETVVRNVTSKISDECFKEGTDNQLTEYVFNFYMETMKMNSVVIWQKDEEKRKFIRNVRNIFKKYMENGEYSAFHEFSERAESFIKEELKNGIKQYGISRIEYAKGLLGKFYK